MGVIIQADGASREFRLGSVVVNALKDASVDVEQGTLTLLQGPSGSGKTTLINLLGALDYPTSGGIFFDGTPIHLLPEPKRDELRRLKMGFVFQSIALISLMSAYENVEFGLRIAGYESRDRRRRAEQCLAFVGLHKRMHHRPNELSGGEQQRVAIARALLHRPDVLLLDESTASLDEASEQRLYALLRTQLPQTTIVSIEHRSSLRAFHRSHLRFVHVGGSGRVVEEGGGSGAPGPALSGP
jgi:putative ABC transport system ATP-binding protein